jgi:dephospho-CoA kinase
MSMAPVPVRLVIGLTGYTCAGKSELSTLLGTRGFARVDMGEITREVARARGLSVARDETWELFTRMVAEAPTWRVPAALERIRATGSELVVVDGLRVKEEVEALRRELGSKFLVLEVRADETLRRERAMARRRDVDPIHWDDLAKSRWEKMDREEVAMVDRIRPLVDVTVHGGVP